MATVTERTKAILQEIELASKINGYPPSRRELAAHLRTSTSVINKYLARMEEDGLIEWDRKVARGIRITKKWQMKKQST